jgi:hypothetical protein
VTSGVRTDAVASEGRRWEVSLRVGNAHGLLLIQACMSEAVSVNCLQPARSSVRWFGYPLVVGSLSLRRGRLRTS